MKRQSNKVTNQKIIFKEDNIFKRKLSINSKTSVNINKKRKN